MNTSKPQTDKEHMQWRFSSPEYNKIIIAVFTQIHKFNIRHSTTMLYYEVNPRGFHKVYYVSSDS